MKGENDVDSYCVSLAFVKEKMEREKEKRKGKKRTK